MRKSVAAVALILLATTNSTGVGAETPDEWVALGARVHGGFGAFIPLGIKIGLDALDRLHLKQRDVSVTYYDSDKSPCACFADGIAIATLASVGQRSLTIEREHASDGTAAVVIIRPRGGGRIEVHDSFVSLARGCQDEIANWTLVVVTTPS